MKKASIIEEKFSDAVKRYDMLSCSSLLVGLSGGADSVVLLYLLKKEAARRGFSLFALHVNHMIRGDEADRDELFCRELCKKWDVPFTAVRVNVPEIAEKRRLGIEEAARNCRYEIFGDFCRENSIERIATAHNASDNLETVIFNLARGSSLRGLGGIPAIRENIVRPLIFCTKNEIVEYASENLIEYVYDSTNSDTDYSRNLIRHKIVPELLKINPSAEDALTRMTLLVRQDNDFIEKTAAEFTDMHCESLARLDDALLGRVIKNAYSAAGGREALGYTHICDVKALVISMTEHGRISLPDSISACIEGSRLVFVKKEEEKKTRPYKIELKMGENIIGEDRSIIFICKENEENIEKREEISKYLIKKQNIYKISIKALLSFDIMNFSLSARSKEDGDRYVFGGMTRKVKKLFSEKKLPLEYRATIPIIECGGEIAWIPSFPVSDAFSCERNENFEKIAIYYMKELL